jgi:periplasmic protein TonB
MNEPVKAWIGRIALVAGMLLALVLAALLIRHLIGGAQSRKHYVSQISLIKPPPPPPLKEEKPPEPVKREEVKIDQPKPEQTPEHKSDDNKPAGKDLGLDAQGSGPGDGFGLAGRPGGTDLLATGGGAGGGNRAQFSIFTSSAQQILLEEIRKHLKLKNRAYRANYKIWLDGEGNIKRFELTPTGVPEIDDDLRNALAEVRGLNLVPPPDMPQPLRFQFTARPARCRKCTPKPERIA